MSLKTACEIHEQINTSYIGTQTAKRQQRRNSLDKARLAASLMSRDLTFAQNCQVAKTVYMESSGKQLGNVESLLELIPVNRCVTFID